MSDSPLAVTRKDKKERETITKVSAGAVIIQRDNIRNRFQQSQEELRLQYAKLHKTEDQSKLDMVATVFERCARALGVACGPGAPKGPGSSGRICCAQSQQLAGKPTAAV